jgi:uracil-DNA glycosylase
VSEAAGGDLFGASAGLPANALAEPLAAHFDRVTGGWRAVTEVFRQGEAGRRLIQAVDARRAAGACIYPREPLRALTLTPLEQVRAVILGQDPYHGPGQAEGLAFSVPQGLPQPPSLRNLFKELQRDLGVPAPRHGSLRHWAEQGLLLLNTSLTVEDGQPASHARLGWEALTDALIAEVARQPRPIAFLLWGAHAQKKRPLIEAHAAAAHRVLTANHPSPLSATRGPEPFIGCGHFSALSQFGQAQGWRIVW